MADEPRSLFGDSESSYYESAKTILKNRWPLAGGDPGTCKGCGAAVTWIRTSNDRPMPVSMRTEPGTIERDGKTVEVDASIVTYDGEKWGYPHHIDCPKANEFRRRR